jgi:hypothetical protein
MFPLAVKAGLLYHKPHIQLLRENNVRTGSSMMSRFAPCCATCRSRSSQ